LRRVLKLGRLEHADSLMEIAMEKGVLHIELLKGPTMLNDKRKD
jgi:hypothetical protein